MKKLIFLLFALFLTTAISAQMQHYNSYGCGTITFRDGHEETYDWVTLPFGGSQIIEVKNDMNQKKKQKIDGKDIQYITYWHEKRPEEKYRIYCVPYLINPKKDITISLWCQPIMRSKWGTIFRSYRAYQFDPNTGDFYKWVEQSISFAAIGKQDLEEWQPIFLLRTDKDYAVMVGTMRSYTDRKTKEDVAEYCWPSEKATEAAEFFKDNPEIYQQILDGTLKASDLQYILDQM